MAIASADAAIAGERLMPALHAINVRNSVSKRVTTHRTAISMIGEKKGGRSQFGISLFLELASQPLNEATTRQEIEQFFDRDHTGTFRKWYSSAIEQYSEDYELLLDRVPFF